MLLKVPAPGRQALLQDASFRMKLTDSELLLRALALRRR
jgi:hypothetical protein